MPQRGDLRNRYVAALQCYLAEGSEAALQGAYEIGREAVADGFGVLDIAQLHREALGPLLRDHPAKTWPALLESAHTFFAESLSPFEMTHRGFREANVVLQRSEARYRSLVEEAPLGIARCTPEGRFISANPALVALLGYGSEAELLAVDPVEAVYASRDPADVRRSLRQFLEAHAPARVVAVEWRRKNGAPIAVHLTGRAVRDDPSGLECIEIMCEDVTERRKLEAQLQHAQKMEAIGQLAGGVAHDFNNFITGITLCSHLLARSLKPRDPRRAQLEEIQYAASRAALLTQQLLTVGRRQVVQPKILDLNRVVVGIAKLLGPLLGADVRLVTRLCNEVCAVEADQGQLEQVIMNLAVNARDAMPDGGTLTVTTELVGADRLPADDRPPAASRYVCLVVADTGIGMDEETRSRVFEPFFTTKPSGKGTGLGLSIVYGVVVQSGGRIGLESLLGKGTRFSLYFPCVEGTPEVAPVWEAADAQLRGSETVLLVEDDRSVRHAARSVLEEAGYTVYTAESGEEALRLIEQDQALQIDLLIVDVVMPEMGGRTLARRVHARQPRSKILYISGYPDETIAQRGVVVGDMPFLQKPFTPQTLVEKVRVVLDGRTATLS